LAAAVSDGGIYLSQDSGLTWLVTSAPLSNWQSVACSAGGRNLAAAANGGALYVSADFGSSWDAASVPVTNWYAAAVSTDGAAMLAAAGGQASPIAFAAPGPVFISYDSGENWRDTGLPSLPWTSVAVSANGTRLAAAAWNGSGASLLFTSTNSGASWTSVGFPYPYLTSIAASADGRTLWGPTWSFPHCYNQLACSETFQSVDFGSTWVKTGLLGRGIISFAPSADGTLCAAFGGSTIYTSADTGLTWMSNNAPVTNWSSLASSADGTKLVAVVNGGGIYTSQTVPEPSLNVIRYGSNLELSWLIPSSDFVLQESSTLITTNWAATAVTPALNLTNLYYEALISPANSNQFYRLKH
jgi:hypothetical protein